MLTHLAGACLSCGPLLASQHAASTQQPAADPARRCRRLPAGIAGALSRTATAPMDRLKMLLQIQDSQRGLTIKEGVSKMAAEGAPRAGWRSWLGGWQGGGRGQQAGSMARPLPDRRLLLLSGPRPPPAGSARAFFKGNGTNVVKIAPETAIKLTLNDALKRVRLH